MNDIFKQLEDGVYAALGTYSNVHRGKGHHSRVTTHLFEKARDIVLEHLGLNKQRYVVIFSTPWRASILKELVREADLKILSSRDLGLSIGVRALVVRRRALPGGVPFHTGGGTTKLISKDWVIWADPPDRFEAGTPAIMNIITFAKALVLLRGSGQDQFPGRRGTSSDPEKILYPDDLQEDSGENLLTELKTTLVGKHSKVPTATGERSFINLDNGASTPTFQPIWEVYRRMLGSDLTTQQGMIGEVKRICAKVMGLSLDEYDILFTSNTTEAINLVAENVSREDQEGIDHIILNTIMEHSSNDLPWRYIQGHTLLRMEVDRKGFLDLEELEKLLQAYNRDHIHENKRIRLLALSAASNVLGRCQEIEEVQRITRKYDVQLLLDAAQLIAHRKLDLSASGIDYLAFSGHKVYAPFGTGVLIVRKGLLRLSSGELGTIIASGEENASGIAALGKSLELLSRIGWDLVEQEERDLTRKALRGIASVPGFTVYGIREPEEPGFSRKIGVIVFTHKTVIAYRVARELALLGGIGVRSGCLCAHIIIKHILNVSPGLERFQRILQNLFPKLNFPGVVRISFGLENGMEDVETLLKTLKGITAKSFAPREIKKQVNDFVRDSTQKVYDNV